MGKSTIHDRGRGPEIEGSRITVYAVMESYLDGWTAPTIRSAERNRKKRGFAPEEASRESDPTLKFQTACGPL